METVQPKKFQLVCHVGRPKKIHTEETLKIKREKRLQNSRRYYKNKPFNYKTDEYRKYIREYRRKYRSTHVEESRAAYRKASAKKRKEDPEKVNEVKRLMRAKKLEQYREADKRQYHNMLKKDPNYHKNYMLQACYNMSIDTFNEMKAAQNNVCAICYKSPKLTRRLVVDHNHTTGKVRDLLCDSCNKGLGFFKESASSLLNAIAYLKKHSGEIFLSPSSLETSLDEHF